MKTLKLEHLAPYLPYGLNVKTILDNRNYKTGSIYKMSLQLLRDKFKGNSNKDIFRPILRPLSDLTKEIEHNVEKVNVQYLIDSIRLGVQPYEYIDSAYDIELNIETEDYSQNIDLFDGYKIVQILLKYHFDIFGLIKQNLAIDINTLEK